MKIWIICFLGYGLLCFVTLAICSKASEQNRKKPEKTGKEQQKKAKKKINDRCSIIDSLIEADYHPERFLDVENFKQEMRRQLEILDG
jgi:hypothetical protein